MTAITADLIERLSRNTPKVVVVGDAILDVWLSGHSDRLCREAPAPVVDVGSRSLSAGGAANTAVNLAAMGAKVRFVSLVGDDDAGRELRNLLTAQGVDTQHVVVSGQRRTVGKHRVVADEQVLVRFDEGDGDEADGEVAQQVGAALDLAVEDADALVVCDYGNGLFGPAVRETVARVRETVPLAVVDAHDFRRWRSTSPDLVTPNAGEAARLLDSSLPENGARAELFERRRAELLDATGAKAVVVTLDREGALLLTPDGPGYRTWADPVPESQASGAGDTFVAALCLGAAASLPLTASMELAQAAACVVVHKSGTSVCTWTELSVALTRESALDPDELERIVAGYHEAGRTVVFTNGCFDVLHRGHITYLNEAKRQGDVLIVAVNSDDSVRRLKGPDRPVNTAQDRAAVLSALSCVDHVTVFDEDTPINLLRRLEPELYVKGGDYTENMLKEAPVVRSYGGEVRALGYVPEQSTTSVIEKIRTGSVLGEEP
ncbi:D-glycero-beta-D-manno-heptose 1-phosphate adenylyltransferase [Amycolatopsis acidiphila]|uniref:Bifunctional protein HldE n=1 Tax=Amycolatopsis acidiphila TaxID=715473 RepID=A0A558A6G6_9PSEU|nr:D-glycero-beta-D-manno-heptose 1-phosphate adenylyltransferase [Amycolatopsis acidiphila]TVT19851.1 D-glycero-beta-D-manno-heptose 1-phosphate adenylyltransferase [Amycolatopsis acidiphila]UIJ58760.1 D-glycero-beta-D-manno-heptose 1-phosphate adenylyltransferase [Amycolatopsis acidiphila]